MVKIDEQIVKEELDHVYTDMLMLEEGIWIPDAKSIKATLDTIGRIANLLDINLTDTRE